ncbi:SbcC/MukB-like Walker B domain-containing protein [Halodesulfovibrio aestuarii]|uniref:SbcC/MukB-like Walker B domain-containing protein n=1 Tax=Halodesulfovibrio aestuarii TaxID=126333 RepID=UPI00042663BB
MTLDALLDGKMLREYQAEQTSLLREQAYITQIKSLEEFRNKLKDGDQCPLCGSYTHPFSIEGTPVPDEIEEKLASLEALITKAEVQIDSIKKLQDTEISDQAKLHTKEKAEGVALYDKKTAEKTSYELEENLKTLRINFKALKVSTSEKLTPLGITNIPEKNISSLLEQLQLRQKNWIDHTQRKSQMEKSLNSINSDIEKLEAVINIQLSNLKDNQKKLTDKKNEYTSTIKDRKELYGEKQPDHEEKQLNKAILIAEKEERNARILHASIQKDLTSHQTQLGTLTERIKKRNPILNKYETEFLTDLKLKGFIDEVHFKNAKLTAEERTQLALQAEQLNNTKVKFETLQKDQQQALDTELAKKVTDSTLEDLKDQAKIYAEKIGALRDSNFEIMHKLKANDIALAQRKKKEDKILKQQKEFLRWDNLHDLIGSSDGKKYRTFAQGLTFELMVSHANQQLTKMTDRYLLIRDKVQPLELNVVDNYQAGEIRSIKNLSGGESFIISLVLALGLSKMSSQKVRVDSLFLDEGFGSLDDDALDTALETLSSLQQDGKLIGVISHVSALKERINTQLKIAPTSGGRSTIQGPGTVRH